MKRFTLFFNFGNRMIEYPLEGLDDRHIEIPLHKYGVKGILRLEVWDNQWIILEDETMSLYVNKHQVNQVNMMDNLIVVVRCANVQFSILVRDTDSDLTCFTKYIISGVNSISVGSAGNNNVCFRHQLVYPNHFVIQNQNGGYRVGVIGKAPVYLNTVRIENISEPLAVGDVIIFADVKMIYLGNLIAFNHSSMIQSNLAMLTSQDIPEGKINYLSEVKFSRIPRLMEPLDDEDVTIEAPPPLEQPDDTPLLFTIGPAVTMPMPMLLSMAYRMSGSGGSGGNMMIGMCISMIGSMVIGLVWNMLRKNYAEKKRKMKEAKRLDLYTKYIEKKRKKLEDKKMHNSSLLLAQYLTCYDLFLAENHKNIWNRNIHHTDFLTIRLGTGCMENPYKINVPEETFTMDPDELAEEPRKVRDDFKFLTDIPSVVDLRANPIIGVIGKEENVHTIIRVMLTQIAALHSYNDVCMAFFYDENKGVNYDWVRWYPHTFIKDKSLRLVAKNKDEMTNVMAYMQNVMRSRKEALEETEDTTKANKEPSFPYFVIFFLDEEMLDLSALSKYFDPSFNLNATYILGFNDISTLPNECNAIVQADEGYMGFYNLDAVRKEPNKITFEVVTEKQAEWYARSLMGLNLKEVAGSSGGSVPNYVDFMSLIKVGDLNNYPLEKKYRENRAYESIKAVYGVGEGGKEQILDLHEKKYGPHGLVAGTTGSGKSETLQTIILSWMMNYSPDEVAFVLIDYKGGGMANAFIGAPHVAGTITNISDGDDEEDEDSSTDSLDQNQTRRALIAIKSEIKRRQRLFKKSGVNHVDQYMRLYRKGEVSEPLPHLIIISDEFAELKQQQPEFIKELVSAARVGRSLGVHLILATQKPSNSVDDEIWANSRFKICLRVQDKADSNGMLHRPEAAFLTKTGRGYFQLGNDEIFEEFQSGYSGAEYIPTDVVESLEDTECRMIEFDGTDTYIEREHKEKREDSKSQLAACVEFITKTSERIGYKPARQLWAPQLRRKMYLNDVLKFCVAEKLPFTKGVLGVTGLVDDPEQQTQYPLYFDFLSISNLLLFGQPGFGKTTFIKTLMTSLITMYTPNQVQFYAFDFSSRTLKMFKKAPHCGDVVFEDDEEEYIQRLFQMLLGIVEERKRLFGEVNVGSISDYLAIEQIPVIILFIDNIYPFKQGALEKYAGALDTLVRSSKYGIQVVATVNKENEINSRIKQNFLTTVCLSMTEKIEYRTALGIPVTFTPSPYKGRGMCNNNGNGLEFHTALPAYGATELERNKALTILIEDKFKNNITGVSAREIPVIPKNEPYSLFFDKYSSNSNYIPLGYNTSNIKPYYYDLNETYCLTLSDTTPNLSVVSTCMRNITYAAHQYGHKVYYLQFRSNIRTTGVKFDGVYKTNDDYKEFLPFINNLFNERNALLRDWRSSHPDISEEYMYHVDEFRPKEHIFVIVDSMLDFFTFCTSMDLNIKKYNESYTSCMQAYFDKGSVVFGIHFIMGCGVQDFSPVMQGSLVNLSKVYFQHRTGIHFGGNMTEVKSFDSALNYNEKSRIRDLNIANTVHNGKDIEFVIPVELE